jgi:hypothetical protein
VHATRAGGKRERPTGVRNEPVAHLTNNPGRTRAHDPHPSPRRSRLASSSAGIHTLPRAGLHCVQAQRIREDFVEQHQQLKARQDISDASYQSRLQALQRRRDRALERLQTIYPSVSQREQQARQDTRRAMVEASAGMWTTVIESLERDYPGAVLPRLPEF